jgi:hypothetical protein
VENREIKFRVWGKSEKRFLNEYSVIDNTVIPLSINFNGMIATSFYSKPIRISDLGHGIKTIENQENYIIQQFTGIKDLTGREIYEGDLVNFLEPGFPPSKYPENWENQEVFYSGDDACFFFGRECRFHPYKIKKY